MIKFPQVFFWGAATSSHQVEGGNVYNDWWQAEEKQLVKEASLSACKHYELYSQDFSIASELGHNCHRFSIEWSRIEPQEGVFQQHEIRHYRKVLEELKDKGLEPIVTLHHFTNPVWFSRKGGWIDSGNLKYFLRFAEKMAQEFCAEVKFWITINEPLVYSSHSYLLGVWPPQRRSLSQTYKVTMNMARAHVQAYRALHRIYREKGCATPQVGIAANLQAFEICQPTLKNKLALFLRNKFYNFYFIDLMTRQHALDYIGVNYYSRNLIDAGRWSIRDLLWETCQKNHHPLPRNSLGWDIYPHGLYKLLIQLKKYNLPVLITENGICTQDDQLRWDYIREHLEEIGRAMDEGSPVFGYIYWSLLDNFEWDKGFAPRFGLVEVDYPTQRRLIRQSARNLAQVCKSGQL